MFAILPHELVAKVWQAIRHFLIYIDSLLCTLFFLNCQCFLRLFLFIFCVCTRNLFLLNLLEAVSVQQDELKSPHIKGFADAVGEVDEVLGEGELARDGSHDNLLLPHLLLLAFQQSWLLLLLPLRFPNQMVFFINRDAMIDHWHLWVLERNSCRDARDCFLVRVLLWRSCGTSQLSRPGSQSSKLFTDLDGERVAESPIHRCSCTIVPKDQQEGLVELAQCVDWSTLDSALVQILILVKQLDQLHARLELFPVRTTDPILIFPVFVCVLCAKISSFKGSLLGVSRGAGAFHS